MKTNYFKSTPATYFNDFTATGTTPVIRCTGELTVAMAGAATSATVVIERASRDPAAGGLFSVVETVTLNPSLGTTVPSLYMEPGVGWWRARLTALTGSPVQIDFSYTEATGGNG